MARKRNSLAIIHAAIADPVARDVLGSLSRSDLKLLSEHVDSKTMTPALQPLLDHNDLTDAYAAMPSKVSLIMKKLPPDTLSAVKQNLASLQPEGGGPVECGCK